MNLVFVNPGIYSCAVDAFLEVSTQLFLPFLSNLPAKKNEFIDLLQFNACSDYISSREDSLLLGEIREPEWLYIIDHCSSFVARVCNACFSQVFERRTLRFMNILSKRRAC